MCGVRLRWSGRSTGMGQRCCVVSQEEISPTTAPLSSHSLIIASRTNSVLNRWRNIEVAALQVRSSYLLLFLCESAQILFLRHSVASAQGPRTLDQDSFMEIFPKLKEVTAARSPPAPSLMLSAAQPRPPDERGHLSRVRPHWARNNRLQRLLSWPFYVIVSLLSLAACLTLCLSLPNCRHSRAIISTLYSCLQGTRGELLHFLFDIGVGSHTSASCLGVRPSPHLSRSLTTADTPFHFISASKASSSEQVQCRRSPASERGGGLFQYRGLWQVCAQRFSWVLSRLPSVAAE
jgi:hypothetical protein